MKSAGSYEKPLEWRGGPQLACSPGSCRLMIVLIPSLGGSDNVGERNISHDSYVSRTGTDVLFEAVDKVVLADGFVAWSRHGQHVAGDPVAIDARHGHLFR